MSLNAAQIAAEALNQGLTAAQATVATAVALAESGGRPDAMGDVSLQNGTWGPSVGLWQVRSLKAQSGTGQARDASKLTDPSFNAASMLQISNRGTNWGAWTTYTNGAYRQNMNTAASGVAAALTQGPRSVISGIGGAGNYSALAQGTVPTGQNVNILNPLDDLQTVGSWMAGTDSTLDVIKKIFSPEIPIRAVETIAGMWLMMIGGGALLYVLAKDATPEPVKAAVRTGAKIGLVAAAPEAAGMIANARTTGRASARTIQSRSRSRSSSARRETVSGAATRRIGSERTQRRTRSHA